MKTPAIYIAPTLKKIILVDLEMFDSLQAPREKFFAGYKLLASRRRDSPPRRPAALLAICRRLANRYQASFNERALLEFWELPGNS